MAKALCRRCKGTAEGSTFEEASSKINHAVGLSRGIKCGDNYNCVEEQKDESIKQSPKETIKEPDVVINEPTSDSPKSGQDTVKTKSKSKKQ